VVVDVVHESGHFVLSFELVAEKYPVQAGEHSPL
jgi:hypothetical protein